MKTFYIVPLLLLCYTGILHAQVDSAALLKEAEKDLGINKISVSSILTDKKYAGIHPLTGFRELIREHAAVKNLVIAAADEPGRKILVKGFVNNEAGQPVPNALVYLYHTSSEGWYAADRPHVGGNEGDRRHARLFGYVRTDANGKFELQTIKPKGYPQSDLPAHIHIEITAPGYTTGLISELLFDDDERLQGATRTRAINEGFIIARPEPGKAPFEQQFSYTITLKK